MSFPPFQVCNQFSPPSHYVTTGLFHAHALGQTYLGPLFYLSSPVASRVGGTAVRRLWVPPAPRRPSPWRARAAPTAPCPCRGCWQQGSPECSPCWLGVFLSLKTLTFNTFVLVWSIQCRSSFLKYLLFPIHNKNIVTGTWTLSSPKICFTWKVCSIQCYLQSVHMQLAQQPDKLRLK